MFETTLSPSVLLTMWAGGMALGTGVVVSWRIVGPGFVWVAGGAALLSGVFAATSGGMAGVAASLLVAGIAVSRLRLVAAVAFVVSGGLFIAHAATALGPVLAVTGALVLGGATCEMLLGHWYLVDPTLPRWALKRLAAVGVGGLFIDTGLVLVAGASGTSTVLGWVHLGLAGLSILLMTGVWFSLKEDGYEGVMAATGLSYLAVLSTLGAVSVARLLLAA